jgi:UrcA family protein
MGEAVKSVAISNQPPRSASSNQRYSTTQETTMNTIATSSPLRSLIAAAIFSAVASGFSAASLASDDTDVPQLVVKYGDLDLSSPQGATALYRRIGYAAEQVCPNLQSAAVSLQGQARACIHKAIADAVIKVNQPALFTEYNARNSSPLPVMVAAGQAR